MIRNPLILIASASVLFGCKQDPFSGDASKFFREPTVKAIVAKVNEEYVDVPDQAKMEQGALAGMLGALDPYSTYMDEKTYKMFSEHTKGKFGGIGVEIAFIDGLLKIISPMDDMPAQRAGIIAGDYITRVNGKDVATIPHGEVIEMIHGEPGTEVELEILRQGEREPLQLKVKRDVVKVNPVKHKIQGDVAYIRLSHFSEVTDARLTEAIQKIRSKLGTALKAVLIDLRNNPGGTLEQSVAVCNLFLDKGIIVQVRGRKPDSHKVFNAEGKDLLAGVRVGILINEGSASASEIMAAALRDNGRATVLGTKSYGKGSVQGVFRIKGMGAVKLTIARFYTPKNEEIQSKGVKPDVEIKVSREEFLARMAKKAAQKKLPSSEPDIGDDPQVQQAISYLTGTGAVEKKS
jgi:carboxyl-terminal processing protease